MIDTSRPDLRSHRRRASALSLVLLGCLTMSCSSGPDILRLVIPVQPAHRASAELLAQTMRAAGSPVQLELVDGPLGPEASLDAIVRREADLAIIENAADYYRADLHTVAPLYSSVLHIARKADRRAATVRELFDGATVFAGPEDAPSRLLLERVLSLYGSGGIDFTYVDALDRNPDIVVIFAPIAPARAELLTGYELFSLARAGDAPDASVADALSLMVPLLRPFVIPAGAYGERTPEPISTVAIDTLFVTSADVPSALVFDLLNELRGLRPLLAIENANLLRALNEDFESWTFAAPLHAGTLAFLRRDEPSFYERMAGVLDSVIAVIVGVFAGCAAAYRFMRNRRKDRIDTLYEQVLEMRRARRAGLTAEQCRVSAGQLEDLREHAYRQLLAEKLSADDNFTILMKLIDEVLGELRAPVSP